MDMVSNGRKPCFATLDIYHEEWIDFNKNGVMDPFENPDLPVEDRVEDLLSRMTLEEKVAQLCSGSEIGRYGIGNLSCVTRKLGPREAVEKANRLQVQAIEKTRLGIPVIIHDECLHGCMVYHATSFPQAIGLAATWNPELVYKVAKAIAKETRSRGIHQCLSPVVNIVRDVRAGRTEESYGEDPYLTAVMGAAFCKALREEGVIATPKHFVANFVGDGGRDSNEIHFSERILREIYFPGFKACIKAGALSVMAAYNSLDGVPCSSNHWLLTSVLRDEWGFEGYVVSDYGSVWGIQNKHMVSSTPEETAKLALESGMDVELPRTEFYGEPLLKVFREGLLPEEVLNEAVRRVLRAKFLIGLFDNPFADPDEAEKINNCEEHARLALESARQAIVLLKNENNTLPLEKDKIKSLTVIGELAKEVRLGGYSGFPVRIVSPLEAIREKIGPNTKVTYVRGYPVTVERHYPIPSDCLKAPDGSKGVEGEYFDNPVLSGKPVYAGVDEEIDFEWAKPPHQLSETGEGFSVRWTGKLIPPETRYYTIYVTSDDGVRVWINNKLVIDSWYDRERSTDKVTLWLEKGKEYDIVIWYYKRGTGKAVIRLGWDYDRILPYEMVEAIEVAKNSDAVIIFAGIVEGEGRDRAYLELPGLQDRLIEEILNLGKPTVVVLMTGSAVTGEWLEKAPAVIQAWYPGQEGGRAIADVLFGDYNPAGRLPFTWPRYVGQLPLYYNYKPTGRGYDYVDLPGTPLFPFGHGLSYTEFKYENLKIDVDQNTCTVNVSFDVENVGEREGDEVVQLYLRDVVASVARPVKELKRFARVTLKPGERKTVNFKLTADDLALYDINMRRVVEPGEFEVMVGASSEDIRLRGSFRIDREVRSKVEVAGFRKEIRNGLLIIRVDVKNNGLVSDLVKVTVNIDGKEELSKTIDIEPGEERELVFKTEKVTEPKKITIMLPESWLESKYN